MGIDYLTRIFCHNVIEKQYENDPIDPKINFTHCERKKIKYLYERFEKKTMSRERKSLYT